MKTLFVLLLGFGGLFPATCSKTAKPHKQSENKHQPFRVIDTPSCANQVVLFGPTVIINKPQRTANV